MIEVLIAMTVLASSIYILSNRQIRSRMIVIRKAEEIERVFFVKKYFLHAFDYLSQ